MKVASKNNRPLNYANIFWLSSLHVVALMAIHFWSWTNFGAMLFGVFFFVPLGLDIGYHRLLTHRSFSTPPWFLRLLVTIGTLTGAGPPIHWVAQHRLHHRYADTELDPHNATHGFWFAHVFHICVKKMHEIIGD